ncbi:MAG: ATP-binding cassette domain-containing protein, partial [Aeromonas sp.]
MIEPSLLEVRGLGKTYKNRTGLFHRQVIEAVKPLSFNLEVGQTLAIIGEAGSGKSTLARMLAGMIKPTCGDITINGQLMVHGDYQSRCKLLRMIFQDANTSLNRKIRVGEILATPLLLNTDMTD